MDKERKSLDQTETVSYLLYISYLIKAKAINTQLRLDQELGLRSEKEKEIFNLYLAKRLLRNRVRLAIADQNNLRFPKRSEPLSFLIEGISRLEEKTKKLKEQVKPERAWTIYTAIDDLNTQIGNKNPDGASFQPTQEMLALWKDKWAPQLVPNTSQVLCHHN